MRIGIDIDDTIINTTATIIECGLEYDRLYKEGRGLKNADAYYFTDIFYWDDADDEAFFDYYRKNKIFLTIKIKEDAKYYINKMYDEGIYIEFITYRQLNKYGDIYEDTKKYLDDNGFKYHKLMVNSGMKGQVCQKENINLFIDDSPAQVENCLSYGVPAILYETNYNQNSPLKKVKTWQEIYEIVKKVKNGKWYL